MPAPAVGCESKGAIRQRISNAPVRNPKAIEFRVIAFDTILDREMRVQAIRACKKMIINTNFAPLAFGCRSFFSRPATACVIELKDLSSARTITS